MYSLVIMSTGRKGRRAKEQYSTVFGREIFHKTLSNGHSYIKVPISGAATTALMEVVDFGAADETSEGLMKGIAHFMEHMNFRPTQDLNASPRNAEDNPQVADKVGMYGPFKTLSKKHGAYLNADTTASATRFMCEIKREHAITAVEQIHSMLTSEIDGGKIDTEFKAVMNECSKSIRDDMLHMVMTTNRHILTNGMGGSIIGEMGALHLATGEQMNRVKRKYYIPSNITGLLVGHITDDTVARYEELWGTGEALPKPIRRGVASSTIQTMPQFVNTTLNGKCPIISVGWKAPMHELKEVTTADLAIKVIEQALERPQIKQLFQKQGFFQAGMYNPETVAPSGFMFLAGTGQPDSQKFVDTILSAVDRISQMPDLSNEVQRLRGHMQTAMTTDVSNCYNFLGNALVYGSWKTPEEVLNHMNSLIQNPATINSMIKETIKNHFRPEKLTAVVGIPREAAQQIAPRNVSHTIPAAAEKTKIFRESKGPATVPSIAEHGHNFVVLHTPGVHSIKYTMKIPFPYSEENEAAHKTIAAYINDFMFDPKHRVNADCSHDLITFNVEADSPQDLAGAFTQFKSCMNSNKGFDAQRYAQGYAGMAMGLSPQAMRTLMKHIYEESPYTNAHALPEKIAKVSFGTAQTHFRTLMRQLKNNTAYGVLGLDTTMHTLTKVQGIIEPFGRARKLNGKVLHRERQSWGTIAQSHMHEEFTLHMDGQEISTLSMFLYEKPQMKRAVWKLKQNISVDTQVQPFPQSQSGMLMVGVPFPNTLDMIHAASYCIDYLSNSMSGVLMAQLRWCDTDNSVEGGCYGANGGESNTSFMPGSHSMGIFAATLGAAKLPRAVHITDSVLRQNAVPMTEDDLRITESRRFGEHALKLGNPQSELQENLAHQLAIGAPVRLEPMKAPPLADVQKFEQILKEKSYFVALTPDVHAFTDAIGAAESAAPTQRVAPNKHARRRAKTNKLDLRF